MKRRHSVGTAQALATSVVACLAVLCAPAVSSAADPSDSRAESGGRASEVLARGAGYGQPQEESRVRALQRRLQALGQRPGPVDGRYGPMTEAAVERLQRDTGISVDGIVGPQTRRVLVAESPPLVPGAGYGQPGGSRQVRAVQRQLRAAGQRPGPVDGRYGPRTRAAIERFQRSAGQPGSGVLSSVTARALARSDDDRPARRSSASQAENSRPDGGPPRADISGPAEGSEQSRSRTRTTVDNRTRGSDGGLPAAAVLLGALVLALVGGGSLLAARLKRRLRRAKADDVRAGPMRTRPVRNSGKEVGKNGAGKAAQNGARKAAKNAGSKAPQNGARKAAKTAGKTPKPTPAAAAPPTPQPSPRADEVAALGYVSVREPDVPDSKELRNQTAAIDMACRDRGLVLKEVIRDLEQVDDADAERPGVDHALRRLAAGDASCLVVAELGRLSRSTPRLGSILESLRGQEARLVSVDEGLDTATKSGSEAADKLRSLSVSEGRRRPPPRGHPPVRLDPSVLRERIREMRASGMTLQEIANRLNEENVPTLRGGAKWRPSGVQAAGRTGGGRR